MRPGDTFQANGQTATYVRENRCPCDACQRTVLARFSDGSERFVLRPLRTVPESARPYSFGKLHP